MATMGDGFSPVPFATTSGTSRTATNLVSGATLTNIILNGATSVTDNSGSPNITTPTLGNFTGLQLTLSTASASVGGSFTAQAGGDSAGNQSSGANLTLNGANGDAIGGSFTLTAGFNTNADVGSFISGGGPNSVGVGGFLSLRGGASATASGAKVDITGGGVVSNGVVRVTGILMASNIANATFTNIGFAKIPTNTAPFNLVGNSFIVTGARNVMDVNRGHHFVHVWGQFTNTASTDVYAWLTNETTHANSPLGSQSTMVAGTNEFNLWLSGSGGDTITMTNFFTIGVNVGVVIYGSEDIAW